MLCPSNVNFQPGVLQKPLVLGVEPRCQRVVGSQPLGGIRALQPADGNAVVGGQRCACGQLDVLQQRQIRRAGGVDIVLAHAPVRGFGDGDDYAHMGFEAFLPLLDRYKPRYFVHGHVHMEYGRDIARMLRRGDTTIINAYERYTLEV